MPDSRDSGKRKKKKPSQSVRKAPPPPPPSKNGLWLGLALGSAAVILVVGGLVAFKLLRPKKEAAEPPQQIAAAPPQKAAEEAPPKSTPPAEPPPAPKPEPKPAPPPKKPAPPSPVVALARPAARKAKPSVVKLRVPDQAAQDKAEKEIKETYKEDYAKRRMEDHLALAVKLLQPGRENRRDPALWFVLLREARDAAVRAEKPRLMVEAVDEIDKWFIIDAYTMKLQILRAMIDAGGDTVARAVKKTALSQVEEARAEDNYDVALRMLDVAEAAARKDKNDKLLDKQLAAIAESRHETKSAQEVYRTVTTAREKLRQTPNDAGANLVVGRHACFAQGLWDEGLPILAKGGDDADAVLARRDLAPPRSIKDQIGAGDGWWGLSRKLTGRLQRNVEERAFAWYELVQPVAEAEDKKRLTERMQDVLRSRAAHIPRLLPGSFFGRAPEDRILLLREGGGNRRSEEAIERGLQWLALHQTKSGKWSNHAFHLGNKKCNCSEQGDPFDIAGTAFGLLPFLGAGETAKRGRYKETVQRGLTYLMGQQKPEGKFSDHMYENALATTAICEAYGLTKSPQYLARAQAAVNFIVNAQDSGGSWGYSPRIKGDTSITGWQFSALKAAYYAGLSVPSATFARAGLFLDEVADPNGLGYGYNTRGSLRATTAVGLMCREYLGWWPSHPGLVKGMAPVLAPENFVTKDKPSIYFLYYATQVMHHAGGEEWEKWNTKVRELLIETQDAGTTAGHEHQKGSWSPRGDDYAKQGGRMMYTSLALLTLEVYYYSVPLNGYGKAVLRD